MNYNDKLKDYHISSNTIIVENNNPNKEFGQLSYITYQYHELIEIIRNIRNS